MRKKNRWVYWVRDKGGKKKSSVYTPHAKPSTTICYTSLQDSTYIYSFASYILKDRRNFQQMNCWYDLGVNTRMVYSLYPSHTVLLFLSYIHFGIQATSFRFARNWANISTTLHPHSLLLYLLCFTTYPPFILTSLFLVLTRLHARAKQRIIICFFLYTNEWKKRDFLKIYSLKIWLYLFIVNFFNWQFDIQHCSCNIYEAVFFKIA